MYALTIENPDVESLAREVFERSPISENSDFHAFLEEQKIRLDFKESVEQSERGGVLDEDEAFKKLYAELGL